MNLIEQLGGYENAKERLKRENVLSDDDFNYGQLQLLKYRRQHNIFEEDDKVVSINSAFLEYQGVLNIDFINRFDLMLSDDCKGFEVNAICGWSKIIRHATGEEIKVGHRL